MPVHRTTDKGKPAWQWGSQKKYSYKAGDKGSSLRAKKRAIKQGLAVARSESTKPEL